MSFKNLNIKREYESLNDDIARDFYIPLLSCSKRYDRAVAFFSSSILALIARGLWNLRENGGKMRLVISPNLTEEDHAAIKEGYLTRSEVIKVAVKRELRDPVNEFETEHLNLLANLIAEGILDIKIADTEEGMFHMKIGLMCDDEGNIVAFSGSMNESETALLYSCEQIDVFKSWNSNDVDRVKDKQKTFEQIWNGSLPKVKIVDFPDFNETFIKHYKNSPIKKPVIERGSSSFVKIEKYPKMPENLELRSYQKEAIRRWMENDCSGIFNMCTGSGKTLTAMGGLVSLSQKLKNNLSVVIVVPYQHLVEQWVEDINKFNINPIIGYSSSSQKKWLSMLQNAALMYNRLNTDNFFLFICTNDTFKSRKVQNILDTISKDILLIVDEAHNFGATGFIPFLTNKYKYRLALTATLERHHDKEGTDVLKKFFGSSCIDYTLEQAINDKQLTPYYYYPILTYLDSMEMDKYNDLTKELVKHIDPVSKELDEKGKLIAVERSRIVAGAKDKLFKLKEIIKPFINDCHMLIYCGAANLLTNNDEDNEEDLKQINNVSMILGRELGMKVAHFTSQETIEDRKNLKNQFEEGRIQALIAIKCLDEGVNIPSIKTAFILSSTTNPKEYIQRRGRVLRLSPKTGKKCAVIYDFVTLPRSLDNVSSLAGSNFNSELTLIRNELTRIEEFVKLSENKIDALKVIDDIKIAYHLNKYN